jgi:hypothetical protein
MASADFLIYQFPLCLSGILHEIEIFKFTRLSKARVAEECCGRLTSGDLELHVAALYITFWRMELTKLRKRLICKHVEDARFANCFRSHTQRVDAFEIAAHRVLLAGVALFVWVTGVGAFWLVSR